MKRVIIYLSFILLSVSCSTNQTTKKLSAFLQTVNVEIKNYKVICIVPADGCYTCIEPSLEYLEKAKHGFLLVLSSNFQKSINFVIKARKIEISKVITDSKNLAMKNQLVFTTAPSIYFIKRGHVKKKIDLSESYDQVIVFKEVDQYLSK